MTNRRIRGAAAVLPILILVAGCAAAPSDGTAGSAGSAATTSAAEVAASAMVAQDGTTAAASATASGATSEAASAATAALAATHADPADAAWDPATAVEVVLSDDGSTGGAGVAVDADVVTITAAGTYRLSGSLADGRIVVDTADDGIVRLVLDGVSIASATSSPLTVVDAEEVVVVLADGSRNALSDATTYVYESADTDEPNAALFSAADLTIAGEGSLTVTGNANDGIAGKDGLVIAGGDIAVTAVDDGVRGKDYVVVTGGTLAVEAGGQALKSDDAEDATLGYVRVSGGTLDLTAGGDALNAITAVVVDGGSITITAGDDAIHSDARLEIAGGTIDVTRSYEGLEGTQIVISGGATSIVAQDDGLNVAGGNDGSAAAGPGGAAGLPPAGGSRGGAPGGPMNEAAVDGWYAEVSGGTLLIDAGGDGFDSNGSASITGGTVVIDGPTNDGNGAIDVNGELLVSDAVLVASGSGGMAETPSASSAQAFVDVAFNATQPAGTAVTLRASDGTAIATVVPSKDFRSIVFSSPALVPGATYEVLVGGTVAGEGVGSLHLDADSTGGTPVGSVSAVAG